MTDLEYFKEHFVGRLLGVDQMRIRFTVSDDIPQMHVTIQDHTVTFILHDCRKCIIRHNIDIVVQLVNLGANIRTNQLRSALQLPSSSFLDGPLTHCEWVELIEIQGDHLRPTTYYSIPWKTKGKYMVDPNDFVSH